MHTLLIMTVLLSIGAAVYQLFVLREALRGGEWGWRVLIDPRPLVPRRLRAQAAGLWVVALVGLGALVLLWL